MSSLFRAEAWTLSTDDIIAKWMKPLEAVPDVVGFVVLGKLTGSDLWDPGGLIYEVVCDPGFCWEGISGGHFFNLFLQLFFQAAEEPEQEEPEAAEVKIDEEEGNETEEEEVKKVQKARRRTEEVREKLTGNTVEALNLESSGADKDTLTSLQAEIQVLREESVEAENELMGLVEVDEKDKPP